MIVRRVSPPHTDRLRESRCSSGERRAEKKRRHADDRSSACGSRGSCWRGTRTSRARRAAWSPCCDRDSPAWRTASLRGRRAPSSTADRLVSALPVDRDAGEIGCGLDQRQLLGARVVRHVRVGRERAEHLAAARRGSAPTSGARSRCDSGESRKPARGSVAMLVTITRSARAAAAPHDPTSGPDLHAVDLMRGDPFRRQASAAPGWAAPVVAEQRTEEDLARELLLAEVDDALQHLAEIRVGGYAAQDRGRPACSSAMRRVSWRCASRAYVARPARRAPR